MAAFWHGTLDPVGHLIMHCLSPSSCTACIDGVGGHFLSNWFL